MPEKLTEIGKRNSNSHHRQKTTLQLLRCEVHQIIEMDARLYIFLQTFNGNMVLLVQFSSTETHRKLQKQKSSTCLPKSNCPQMDL